jgi:chromosome segregation and condensation protein ScpB
MGSGEFTIRFLESSRLASSAWSRIRILRRCPRLRSLKLAPRLISEQTIEVVVIIAMKQPVSIPEINEIRGIKSTATLQTLHDSKLVERTAQLGPHREKYWCTAPLFLETFGVSSLLHRATTYLA